MKGFKSAKLRLQTLLSHLKKFTNLASLTMLLVAHLQNTLFGIAIKR